MSHIIKISEKFFLDAPRDFTYEFLTDLRNDQKWYPAVRDIRIVATEPSPPHAVTYDQELTMLGLHYTSRIQVRRTEPPRQAELHTVNSRIPFVCTYTLESVESARTKLIVTAEVSAAGPFRLLGPLFKVALLRRVKSHFAHLPEALIAEKDQAS